MYSFQFPDANENARPIVIFPGPDGLMWFTEERGNAYGTITEDGKITEYPTGVEGGMLAGATFDSVGNLWLQFNRPDIVQRVAKDKSILTFKLPSAGAVQHRITYGSDGKIWLTQLGTDKVAYIEVD